MALLCVVLVQILLHDWLLATERPTPHTTIYRKRTRVPLARFRYDVLPFNYRIPTQRIDSNENANYLATSHTNADVFV